MSYFQPSEQTSPHLCVVLILSQGCSTCPRQPLNKVGQAAGWLTLDGKLGVSHPAKPPVSCLPTSRDLLNRLTSGSVRLWVLLPTGTLQMLTRVTLYLFGHHSILPLFPWKFFFLWENYPKQKIIGKGKLEKGKDRWKCYLSFFPGKGKKENVN